MLCVRCHISVTTTATTPSFAKSPHHAQYAVLKSPKTCHKNLLFGRNNGVQKLNWGVFKKKQKNKGYLNMKYSVKKSNQKQTQKKHQT